MNLKKLFLKGIVLFLLVAVIPAWKADSQEVTLADHWAKGDIMELNARGIIDMTIFNPNRPVTQLEFVKMLMDCKGLTEEAAQLAKVRSPFSDIPANHSFRGYMILAREMGIEKLTSSNINEPLTRQEMLVYLFSVMGLAEDELPKGTLEFTDKEEIYNPALSYVYGGVTLGLVSGFEDNTFRPREKVTLGETAAVINRWLELTNDRYDYIGNFKEVDELGKNLLLEIEEKVVTFPLKTDTRVFIYNYPGEYNSLKMGDKIAVKLNEKGEVLFIKKDDLETYNQLQYNLNIRQLPESKRILENWVATSGLFNPRLPMDIENMQLSLDTTKAEINLSSLLSAAGTDGRGNIIALIDTGVDPSHPDLAVTTTGSSKIVDWIDFTSEGIVDTSSKVKKMLGEDWLSWKGKKYHLGDIPSLSDIYRLGSIKISDIAPLEMLNSYAKEDELTVLLVDSTFKGVYDTVYIDSDQDGNFVNEKALKVFRKSNDYSIIVYQGRELGLALSDIDSNGDFIQLSTDVSGHGTHVAGIIAANGRLKGVAPGAQLMVLKAVERDGYANPENIIEAIKYAALHGAHIINISLGQYEQAGIGKSELTKVVDEVVDTYGVVIVAAAGNIGPGINSTASPADSDKVISVGAFVSPRMWEIDFGYNVPEDSLYYFSSVGPRNDGSWYPSIIAPGSAVSTVPRWMDYPYMLTEGTSMAAPHVAGAVAHLLENAANLGMKVTPAYIKRAIEESARDIKKFKVIEDGHGVLDTYKAWLTLKKLMEEPKIEGVFANPVYQEGQGIYARDYLPQNLYLKLHNNDNKEYLLNWTFSEPWLTAKNEATVIGAKGDRDLSVEINLPEEAGLYSGTIIGDDQRYLGTEVEIPVTIIKGEEIQKSRPYVFTTLGSLKPAQLSRFFIKVPEGVDELTAQLEVFPNTSGSFEGRGRLHLINPAGLEEKISEYAGLAPYALGRKNKVTSSIYWPQEGTWEIVVYSSASLSAYNMEETKYQLTVKLGDMINIESFNENGVPRLLLSPISLDILKRYTGPVTLHIWEIDNRQPFCGLVEVNGRLYEVQDGKLEYPAEKLKDNKILTLTLLK